MSSEAETDTLWGVAVRFRNTKQWTSTGRLFESLDDAVERWSTWADDERGSYDKAELFSVEVPKGDKPVQFRP